MNGKEREKRSGGERARNAQGEDDDCRDQALPD
jgi:hypothetical protein